MQASGLIVEYNPFHNGHKYHVEEAKKTTGADCMIAVMSGPFLQRGEPALIDPFYRTKAALANGVDIVVLLPFFYAVQSSALFAYGAVQTLHKLGVSSICFGSEEGTIEPFHHTYNLLQQNESTYSKTLKKALQEGNSYPHAHALAFQEAGITDNGIDLKQPNNILGYSYTHEVRANHLPITMQTIKRKQNMYHDREITTPIASATSIRKHLLTEQSSSVSIQQSMPQTSEMLLHSYKDTFGTWHDWETYFPLIHYRVLSMSVKQLAAIYTIDEGIEHRIKETASKAHSFAHWLDLIKTKRYTRSRLQRMFVFILGHVTKTDVAFFLQNRPIPYIHLLGMTENGRAYLHSVKKKIDVPVTTSFTRKQHPLAMLEERILQTYYSILAPTQQNNARKQAFSPPIYHA